MVAVSIFKQCLGPSYVLIEARTWNANRSHAAVSPLHPDTPALECQVGGGGEAPGGVPDPGRLAKAELD